MINSVYNIKKIIGESYMQKFFYKVSSIIVLSFCLCFSAFAQIWTFDDFSPSVAEKQFLDDMHQLCEDGKFDEAGEKFTAFKKKNPASAYVHKMQEFLKSGTEAAPANDEAVTLYNKGKYKSSRKKAEEILEKNPNDYQARVSRIAALSELEPQNAVKECDKILYYLPQSANILFLRGKAYINQNDYENAIKSYSLSIILAPDALKYNSRGIAYWMANNGKEAEALADFEESLRLDPSTKNPAHVDRARVYYSQGEYAKARPDCETYINAGGKEFAAFDILVGVNISEKKYDDALALGNKYLEINKASAYQFIARTYRMMGEKEKALEACNKALEAAPNYADALNIRGLLYQKMGKIDEAIEDYTRAIEIHKNKLEKKLNIERNVKYNLKIVYKNRAYAYRKNKEFEKAVEDYKNALLLTKNEQERKSIQKDMAMAEKHDREPLSKTELCWPFIDFEIPIGDKTVLDDVRAKMDAGKYEKAKDLFDKYFLDGNCLSQEYEQELNDFLVEEKAISSIESEVYTLYNKNRFLYSSESRPKRHLKKDPENYRNIILLLTALSVRKPEEAIKKCDELLSYYPMNSLVLFIRGKAYNKLGKRDAALKDYSASLFCKKRGFVFATRGDLYQYKLENHEEAVKDYTEAIKLNPTGSNSAYSDRANAYYNLNDYDKAESDAKRYVDAGGKNFDAFNTLMRVYKDRKKYDDALKYSEKYIELYPKSKRGHNMAGRVYSAMGDHKKAVEEFTKALKQDSKFVSAYQNRSIAYQEMGDMKKALADAEKSLKYAKRAKSNYLIYLSYRRFGYIYIAQKKQKEAIAEFKAANPFATDSEKKVLLNDIAQACALNPDYGRVPFINKDGLVIIPVTLGGGNYKFNFIFDTSGLVSQFTASGIKKLSEYGEKDIYVWKMQELTKREPDSSPQKIQEEIDEIKKGNGILLGTEGLKCGGQKLSAQNFIDSSSSNFAGDGLLSLGAFYGVKNVTIDYKNQFFELNSPLRGENGVPMRKIDSDQIYGYYIMAELDGVKQPFVINMGVANNIMRKATNESTVYEGKVMDSMINSYDSPSPSELGLSRMAEIKIGNLSEKAVFYPYIYFYTRLNNKRLAAFFSLYNSFGYTFFKDKRVQLDFEHEMLYVW